MSLTLTLQNPPEVPLEVDNLIPERLAGLNAAKVSEITVLYGNQSARIGDFFRVDGTGDDELRIVGDCTRIKMIGQAMTRGRIVVDGNAGMHTGAGMAGGEILIEGDTGDWLGAEMLGGRIVIKGNAGHLVGSAFRGGHIGMQGGEIIVHGNAGNEVGNAMRRGLIAIGGDAGDFTGVTMLAGTVVVLGRIGQRTGAGMKRGTIVAMQPTEILPTFRFACTYRPVMLRLVLAHLRNRDLPITEAQIGGRYRRWSGDDVELNRGELLVLQP